MPCVLQRDFVYTLCLGDRLVSPRVLCVSTGTWCLFERLVSQCGFCLHECFVSSRMLRVSIYTFSPRRFFMFLWMSRAKKFFFVVTSCLFHLGHRLVSLCLHVHFPSLFWDFCLHSYIFYLGDRLAHPRALCVSSGTFCFHERLECLQRRVLLKFPDALHNVPTGCVETREPLINTVREEVYTKITVHTHTWYCVYFNSLQRRCVLGVGRGWFACTRADFDRFHSTPEHKNTQPLCVDIFGCVCTSIFRRQRRAGVSRAPLNVTTHRSANVDTRPPQLVAFEK